MSAARVLGQGHAEETFQADLDLVRSLVRSWGNLVEGSVEQATAVRNSERVLKDLVASATRVIRKDW